MSNPDTSVPADSTVPKFNEDLVFLALSLPDRRRLLVVIANGTPQTAVDLQHLGKGRGISSTLKNLKMMVDAGIVVQLENLRDGRRWLYALAPGIKVSREGELTIVDFGFWVVLLSADGN